MYQYSRCSLIVTSAGAENRTYEKIHRIFRATKSRDSSFEICTFSYDLRSTGAKKAGPPNDSIPIWIPCWVFCLSVESHDVGFEVRTIFLLLLRSATKSAAWVTKFHPHMDPLFDEPATC